MYPAFKDSDIILTNSRRMHGSQIAEHAFALLLSLTRRIITQYDFMKEKRWEKAPCVELAGMTMGILGLGGIGRAIAARAKAFEFNVIAVDPRADGEARERHRTWKVRLAAGVHGEIQRRGGLLSNHAGDA